MLSPLFEQREIDPVAGYYELEIESIESYIASESGKEEKETIDILSEKLETLKKQLEDYTKQSDKVTVTIQMFDSLKFKQLQRSMLKAIDSDGTEAFTLVSIEQIQWGVCGHSGIMQTTDKELEYSQEEVEFDGEQHKITARSLVKNCYMRQGWMAYIGREITRLNTLQPEKKSR